MKLLLLPISAGHGHLKAAEAIESRLRVTHPEIEVKNVDALDYMAGIVKQVYNRGYARVYRNLPEFYEFLYRQTGKGKTFAKIFTQPQPFLTEIGAAKLYHLIFSYQPEVILSLHPLPASIVGYIRRHAKKHFRHFELLTDYGPHDFWFQPEVDQYLVPCEEDRAFFIQRGIPSKKVTLSGFPVKPEFTNAPTRRAARAKLKISERTPLVLCLGLTDYEAAIDSLLAVPQELHIVAFCGRNEKLCKKIIKKNKGHTSGKIDALGWVDADIISAYMAAADLVVMKPGGSFLSEALNVQVPILLIQAIPGQEAENSDWALENGLALKANTSEVLTFKAARLLADQALGEKMKARQKAFARPGATDVIIKNLIK